MNKKRIIIYFSYTGTTKLIAEQICEKLKCDIIEIKTKIPYSSNYKEVVYDKNNNEYSTYLPEIIPLSINLDDYDEIILGSPVWWYRPAPAVRRFLKEYDLSNKTIIPFITSNGWFGMTIETLKKLCPNSKIKNICFMTFDGHGDERKLKSYKSTVKEWFSEIKKED